MKTMQLKIDETWEIVHVGFGPGADAFIGRVVVDDDEWVTMCPVYQYSSTTRVDPVTHEITVKRFAVPMEMLGSDVGERIRVTRRRRLVDYDPADRGVFEQVLAGAVGLAQKKREERKPPLVLVPGPAPSLDAAVAAARGAR